MMNLQNRVATPLEEFYPDPTSPDTSEPDVMDNPADERSPGERFCCGEKLQPFLTEAGCYTSVCRQCNRQFFDQGQIHDAHSPWIGVDLDGTLAADMGRHLWDADGRPKIGRPIDEMVLRVKKWLATGFTVKIFTARASSAAQVAAIKGWLARRGLPDLEVTNVKDLNMVMLWDDRCVQVVPNAGRPINSDDKLRSRRTPPGAPGFHRKKSATRFLSRLKIFLAL